jgi:hypothetical protein
MNVIRATLIVATITSMMAWSVDDAAAQQRWRDRAGAWVSRDLATPPTNGALVRNGASAVRGAFTGNPVGAYAGYIRNLTKSTGAAGNAYATMRQRQYRGQSVWGWGR